MIDLLQRNAMIAGRDPVTGIGAGQSRITPAAGEAGKAGHQPR